MPYVPVISALASTPLRLTNASIVFLATTSCDHDITLASSHEGRRSISLQVRV